MNQIPGFHQARDNELVNLIIQERNDDGSLTVTSLYSPTRTEIIGALREHNLPVQYTLDLIDSRTPGSHTVLIDLKEFEEHLKEKGFRQ